MPVVDKIHFFPFIQLMISPTGFWNILLHNPSSLSQNKISTTVAVKICLFGSVLNCSTTLTASKISILYIWKYKIKVQANYNKNLNFIHVEILALYQLKI